MKRMYFHNDIESRERISAVEFSIPVDVPVKEVINQIPEVNAESTEVGGDPEDKAGDGHVHHKKKGRRETEGNSKEV